MHRDPVDEAGFTLIEVLVALTISTLLIVAIMSSVSSSRQRETRAEQKRIAVVMARSLIARGSALPWSDAPLTGKVNGLDWELDQQLLATDRRRMLGLIRIRARISKPDGADLLVVKTRRLKSLIAA
jgi:type II secretion system protein I